MTRETQIQVTGLRHEQSRTLLKDNFVKTLGCHVEDVIPVAPFLAPISPVGNAFLITSGEHKDYVGIVTEDSVAFVTPHIGFVVATPDNLLMWDGERYQQLGTRDFYFEVARGNINGMRQWTADGLATDVGTTSQTIWETGGIYALTDIDTAPGPPGRGREARRRGPPHWGARHLAE